MCGILLTNKQIKNLDYVIYYLKNRGPDAISYINSQGFEFIHSLLSMTGKITKQPFIDTKNNIIAMLNGEIYNYRDLNTCEDNDCSDGECIIPCYLKHGENFIQQFDGEFAIVLCDFNKGIIFASTDIFSTKPLWIALENKTIGISSYKSCLTRLEFNNIIQITSNTTMVIDINTMLVKNIMKVINFDLAQYKTSFTDFFIALENSIKKRTQNAKHGIFIGLSSGYDSGTIACILNKLDINYTAYSIIGSEDEDIINKRGEIVKNLIKFRINREDFMKAREYLKNNCEEYKLNIDNGEIYVLQKSYDEYLILNNKLQIENGSVMMEEKRDLENKIANLKKMINFRKNGQILTDDNGSIGMSYICSIARPKKEIIYLSGSGADEIFSDYGYKGIKHYFHSTIGGHFPEDLSTVFPWKNFFSNTQRAYLMKEEYVTGTYGIEGRYPFLDKFVVQEFLWLKADLKNQYYKAPLHQYMAANNFPFRINSKVGFNCGFTGPSYTDIPNYSYQITLPSEVGKQQYNNDRLVVNFNNINKYGDEQVFFIENKNIIRSEGNCYIYLFETSHLGDICGQKSPYILYENNIPLKFPHSKHKDIELYGNGRYSHWTSTTLYFSSSDNSNPLINGRIYKFSYIY